MINREITYERDINKSYMKIPAVIEICFDEKLIFLKNYTGCIPVEKCFVNGQGQYWYNITGKQALDAYCRANQVGLNFFETLILRICSQLEILEWNLIDTNCLMIDPELIFLNNKGDEISFVLYPCSNIDFFKDLQQLLEYLLTKLNHEEKEAVKAAYKIYEMTLSETYSIADLKDAILKEKSNREQPDKELPSNFKEKNKAGISNTFEDRNIVNKEINYTHRMTQDRGLAVKESTTYNYSIEEKLTGLFERTKQLLHINPSGKIKNKVQPKEEIPMVVYPEDEEVQEILEIHPTICMASSFGKARGLLLYEGCGEYKDYELKQSICFIGKSLKVHMLIERETISQIHAKIEYIDDTYYIEDLNSTNGTYLNDTLLNYKERKILQPGDMVRFADVKYRFW